MSAERMSLFKQEASGFARIPGSILLGIGPLVTAPDFGTSFVKEWMSNGKGRSRILEMDEMSSWCGES